MTTTDDTAQVPPPPPPSPPPHDVRRLERSTDDRIVAGVCGGLGRYFDVDPVIFRVLFAVMAVFGAGFLVYGALWLVVPEENTGRSVAHGFRGGDGPGRELAVIALVVVAGLIAVDGIFGSHDFGDGDLFWWVLVALGIAYFWRRHHPAGHGPHDHGRGKFGFGPVPPPPPPPPPPLWPGTAVPETPPRPSEFWAATATASTSATSADAPPVSGAPAEPWGAQVPAPKPPREKSVLGSLTFSLLMLALGVAALLQAMDVVELSAQAVLAAGLVVIGVALIVGAWVGRSRGLIALGLVVTIAVSAVAALDVPLKGGVGDRTWRPITNEQLAQPFRMSVGDARLDLTEAPLREGHHEIHTSLGIGQLTVILPPGVDVHFTGHVALGDVQAFGQNQEGSDLDIDHADTSSADLVIDARVGIGELWVQREAS